MVGVAGACVRFGRAGSGSESDSDTDQSRRVRVYLASLGVGPARGPWTNLGRLPLRVFSIGKYASQKKSCKLDFKLARRCFKGL